MARKEYKSAIEIFEKIEEIHGAIDSHLRIDAAHAYFATGDTSKARLNYEVTKDLNDSFQASISRNQLGLIALMKGDSAQAINYFKTAIERDNQLKAANYNYELISRLYTPKAPPQNIVEEQQQSQTVIQSEEKEDELQKQESENISRERALQLLDNLRTSESKGLVSRKISKEKIEKDW